jgi:hypothetical protein
MPQMRSVGDACVVQNQHKVYTDTVVLLFQDAETYFHKLPLARLEQFLRHPRAVFCAFGEFVVVTFFDDAGFIW